MTNSTEPIDPQFIVFISLASERFLFGTPSYEVVEETNEPDEEYEEYIDVKFSEVMWMEKSDATRILKILQTLSEEDQDLLIDAWLERMKVVIEAQKVKDAKKKKLDKEIDVQPVLGLEIINPKEDGCEKVGIEECDEGDGVDDEYWKCLGMRKPQIYLPRPSLNLKFEFEPKPLKSVLSIEPHLQSSVYLPKSFVDSNPSALVTLGDLCTMEGKIINVGEVPIDKLLKEMEPKEGGIFEIVEVEGQKEEVR